MKGEQYEIIVVGAGHAGCEAAVAAARLGAQTLLLTIHLDTVAQMSCNPSIGGLAKGHLVREIDALGGIMARIIDRTGIHFRVLGLSRGPAIQGPRAQADKHAYHRQVKHWLEQTPNLTLRQEQVVGLVCRQGRILGVQTQTGLQYQAQRVILTTGTFLQGLVHIGLQHYSSGRSGEPAAQALAANLRDLGFTVGRLKTGTPVRLNARSIDFSKLEAQPGDSEPQPFSFATERITQEQVCCYITYTNARTHAIIRDNLDRSPLYAGVIEGIGPRYCPSIEDKVVKFPHKERHQVFLEPEGRDTLEYYANGISTSLPPDVQLAFVRSITGLEKAQVMRWAYGIEYDFVPPTQIQASLESKNIAGLYLAGQINGTTGYEEAAALGLMAGINAARSLQGAAPVIISRDQAYIGVLIDDLVTRGVTEPYRMFTSRAEYRLLLRHDNADRRLMPLGHAIGLVDDATLARLQAKEEAIAKAKEHLQQIRHNNVTLAKILRRPEMRWRDIVQLDSRIQALNLDAEAARQVEIEIKYEGYLQRQLTQIKRFRQMERVTIPADFDYLALSHLKREAKEKLHQHRPLTLGQAARIPGVTPADISMLMVYLNRHGSREQ